MTDSDSHKLDAIIDKLDKVIELMRAGAMVSIPIPPNPFPLLEEIKKRQNDFGSQIQSLRQELAEAKKLKKK